MAKLSPLEAGLHRVPVLGGELAVDVHPGATETVLAVHGISSHRRLWNWLRVEMPELSLIAPDLRGRADSLHVTGPSSVPQHADDMIALLDAFGLESVHVIGMSMGGFVAMELAQRYPDRVKSLVLVDGGFPMARPPGLTPEMLPQVFADRLARLEQSWDPEEFVQFFTANTAPLLDAGDPLLRDYLELDLDESGKVRLSGEALLSDAASVFFAEPAWQSLDLPIRFLHAEWATGEGSSPAYPDVSDYAKACADVRFAPGTDHASSIMSAKGAAVTAELVRLALGL
jgi:pimeloyl-ACP methyl ester carboxylesterase